MYVGKMHSILLVLMFAVTSTAQRVVLVENTAQFRPLLKPGGEHAEARNVTVEGCTFIGSTAAIIFV